VTEPTDFVTAAEAAKRLGVDRHTILNWLLRGYLQGTMQSRRTGWRIPVAEVDRVARERGRLRAARYSNVRGG
jgi:excisionase family DNA binding protein